MKTYENPQPPNDPMSADPLPPYNVISEERSFNVIPAAARHGHKYRSVSTGSQTQF